LWLRDCGAVVFIQMQTVGRLGVSTFDKKPDFQRRQCMGIQASWGPEALATHPTESSEVEDTQSAKGMLHNEEVCGRGMPRIIGNSAALQRTLDMVRVVAPTNATVLINGETGTGKELIAEAIHKCSDRANGPFVKVNCAAMPAGLLESELFGHERGAFTGAVARRIGRFELASHGTIFLDEIGEVPLHLQPKLLRVLQEREFERLGDSRTLKSDARLIAATNRDLEAMVEEQTFRSDLFYRLNVFPVAVSPLRERPEDIPLLVRHFVQQFSRRMNKSIPTVPSETMAGLVQYPWPGNVRELQNVIERAVILSDGLVLKLSMDELRVAADARPVSHRVHGNLRTILEDAERQQILSALEKTIGKVGGPDGAAALLGMRRTTLLWRMQKLSISAPRTLACG
jgi:formate hydrogenlyase transcriptional activator